MEQIERNITGQGTARDRRIASCSLAGYIPLYLFHFYDFPAIRSLVETKERKCPRSGRTSQGKRPLESAPPEPKRPRLTVDEEKSASEKPTEAYLKAANIFREKDDHSNVTGTREHPQISIWDFGGQEIFYSTQQVFYTHRAIYGMTMDLTKPLDSPVEKADGGPTSHCHTEKDFIDYHLESIRVHTRPKPLHSKDGQTPEVMDIEPPVLFIFTHKDQVTKVGG
ncbi:uncharacterized protein LOC144879284 [Branchiostoma floridae x Branchiostoma japonicum]